MAIGTTLRISFDSKKVQRGLASISKSFGDIGKRFAQIGVASIAAGLTAAVIGFGAFAKGASEAASELEGMKTAFTVLTGDATKAQKVLEEIREFGATTPLEQKDLQKSAQTLMAFGVSLEDVMPSLRMLGDISMGNAEKLGSLALVFGQVSSAGKLTGGDLLQFVNVGFNPLNEIAKRTGKSMGELRDMMSKGAITTAMVKQAFQDATGSGGMFNGMLNKMAETTQGKLSNLSDNIAALKVAFGTGFNDGLKVAVDAVNSRLPQMVESFKRFGDMIGAAISESVNGNFDKLASIGDLIGTIISEAANKAFKTGIRGIGAKVLSGVDSVENTIREKTGLSNIIGSANLGARATDAAGVMASEDSRQMMNAIRQSFAGVMNGPTTSAPPGYRYAGAGESSTLRDGNGAAVIQVLRNIQQNTAGGAKM